MKVLWLVAATVGVCGTALAAAVLIDGPEHWLPGGVGLVICLLPAIGTLIAAQLTERGTAVASLGFVLVAPLIRLVLALAVGGLVGYSVPELKAAPARFVFWVAGCYLVTLVAETALLLARPTSGLAKPTDS